jgi:hypothetical protein
MLIAPINVALAAVRLSFIYVSFDRRATTCVAALVRTDPPSAEGYPWVLEG